MRGCGPAEEAETSAMALAKTLKKWFRTIFDNLISRTVSCPLRVVSGKSERRTRVLTDCHHRTLPLRAKNRYRWIQEATGAFFGVSAIARSPAKNLNFLRVD